MTDDLQLTELTRRQEEILSLVIQSYTSVPEPVSSKSLCEAYDLSYSSATVRNEFAVLDEHGYLSAPHTSSGRVPTQKGYRYFVKRLLHNAELSNAEQQYIASRLKSLPLAIEQWLRSAATQLARNAQTASLVTPPVAETSRFKHIELISIQGRLCLMVLVLQGGSVHQQMLNLVEPVEQGILSDTATRINELCSNLGANEVRMKGIQLQALERDVCELAADLIDRADNNPVRMIYRDGLSDAVASFVEERGAQQALRIFEESPLLSIILDDVIDPVSGDVQVVIAGNGRWEELSHLTMVVSRYGIPGQASGALGVLGPTHLNYARAISSVRYMSELMTHMLQDLYQSDAPPED